MRLLNLILSPINQAQPEQESGGKEKIMEKITATIQRENNKLRIAFPGLDASGWDYPATKEGFADAVLALKNDSLTSAEDFSEIERLTLPKEGEETREVELTGDGDQ